ncbi:MAG: DGQHR domain-containing protein [Acidobacteria bacterium]|nr:DGQHR domain-containing protein [Acidobacteriaceae bacterium]MBV9180246.1 DGQHR domain-containing protein [Acidobacteriota bacterium]
MILDGIVGYSAGREVFLGFAPANILYSLSYADVLNEDTGVGYQRRFDSAHSLDFRKYIQLEKSSTIPLTFNARERTDGAWRVERDRAPYARLIVPDEQTKVFTQVDCQHRLGHLNDLSLVLPFMCFLGLTDREEMEIFNIINGKVQGLSRSLLDFHDSRMVADLAKERPELFIAIHLKDNTQSPWFHQVSLGGNTSGMKRRASLRTLQTAVKRFLTQTDILKRYRADVVAQMVLDFWASVSVLLQDKWNNPRKTLLCKGVGVYALMGIAGDLIDEAGGVTVDKKYFSNKLSDFILDIDWSNGGTFAGLGGEAGAKKALEILRTARGKGKIRLISNG